MGEDHNMHVLIRSSNGSHCILAFLLTHSLCSFLLMRVGNSHLLFCCKCAIFNNLWSRRQNQMLVLQLSRPAHQLFAVHGRLVVLYQDGSLGSTDQLLYQADCTSSLPFIVWSRLHYADSSACIVVVFRDKVTFVISLLLYLYVALCSVAYDDGVDLFMLIFAVQCYT